MKKEAKTANTVLVALLTVIMIVVLCNVFLRQEKQLAYLRPYIKTDFGKGCYSISIPTEGVYYIVEEENCPGHVDRAFISLSEAVYKIKNLPETYP